MKSKYLYCFYISDICLLPSKHQKLTKCGIFLVNNLNFVTNVNFDYIYKEYKNDL